MSGQTFCQLVVVALLIANFFHSLYVDFYGREARGPYGFRGAVATVAIIALMTLVYWGAGAFSSLTR